MVSTGGQKPIQAERNKEADAYHTLNVRLICKDCRNPVPNIIEEFASGDLVCGDCGLVLGDRIIDTRSEWRTFANDEGDDPSRVGSANNPLMEGAQLDTSIEMVGGNNNMAKTLSRALNRTAGNKDIRAKLQAYKDIAALAEAAALSKSVIELAKHIYNMVDSNARLRISSKVGLIAACIFCACRQEGVPRTFKEISSYTGVPKEEIGKCFKAIVPFMKMEKPNITSGEQLMARFCSFLDLSMEVQIAATELITKAKDVTSIAGRSPVSIAASVLYFMSHLFREGRTLTQISEISGVSPSTIRVAYKALYKERFSLVNTQELGSKVSFTYLPTG